MIEENRDIRDSRLTVRFIVGPTASGKGKLAAALARRHGFVLVSMDSMKVYRGMEVGTAKPSFPGTPIRLIDVADPWEKYDVAAWTHAARRAVEEIAAAGGRPLFCGGTGLYLKAFLSGLFEGPSADEGLRAALVEEAGRKGPEAMHARLGEVDPEAAARIHPKDLRRVVRALEVVQITGATISSRQRQFSGRRDDIDPVLIGISRDRRELYDRINSRVDAMMESGFLEEVRSLLSGDPAAGPFAMQALGYRELAYHIEGRLGIGDAVSLIKRNTRRFVRRQMAWFRKFPDIFWIQVEGDSDSPEILSAAESALRL